MPSENKGTTNVGLWLAVGLLLLVLSVTGFAVACDGARKVFDRMYPPVVQESGAVECEVKDAK